MKTFAILAAAAIGTVALPGAAHAQWDANAMFARQNAEMEAAIAATQRQIVDTNVRDPRIVQMYRQAQMQGYRGSLEQFALGYAQTAGYTDAGRRAWAENEERNRQRVMGSVQGLRGAEQNYADAIAQRNGQASQNLYDGGLSLQGRQRYYDPGAGMQTERSYIRPGDNGYDPRTGRTYQQDAQGNYVSCGPDGCFYVRPAR